MPQYPIPTLHYSELSEISNESVIDLFCEAVERGDGHDDQLLRREEVDDEEERGRLQWIRSSQLEFCCSKGVGKCDLIQLNSTT